MPRWTSSRPRWCSRRSSARTVLAKARLVQTHRGQAQRWPHTSHMIIRRHRPNRHVPGHRLDHQRPHHTSLHLRRCLCPRLRYHLPWSLGGHARGTVAPHRHEYLTPLDTKHAAARSHNNSLPRHQSSNTNITVSTHEPAALPRPSASRRRVSCMLRIDSHCRYCRAIHCHERRHRSHHEPRLHRYHRRPRTSRAMNSTPAFTCDTCRRCQ